MFNIENAYRELVAVNEMARAGYMRVVENGSRDQVMAARNKLIETDDALDRFIDSFPEVMELDCYEG
jgi:ribosomal 50S subunit-associated protein YjgA (DUF615 family)